MSGWTLRKAEQGDVVALTTCIDAAYAEYADRITDLPPVSEDMAGEIAQHQVWVADISGEVVGALVLIREDGFMRLANVAVRPDHRRSGVGRALLAHAEAESLRQGFAEMRLTTHVEMPRNVQLYRRLGWHEVQRRGNGVVMRKAVGE